MLQRIRPEQSGRFDHLIAVSPEPDFAQLVAWSKLKPNWRPVHYLYNQGGGGPSIAITVWLRKPPLFPYALAYAPRGPILLREGAETDLAAFWPELKQELLRLGAFALKIDPAWTSAERAAEMERLGFLPIKSDQPFGGTQPKRTIRQDISPESDELLGLIPKKIRYNIRYPEKNGVEYRVGTKEDISGLMDVLRDTSRRKKFIERGPEYYARLLDAMGENASLILGYHQGRVVAAGVTIVCGKIAWAIYGGMLREFSSLRAYYGLNWRRMLWAKSRGAEVFDFFGVPMDLSEDAPLYGLYTFKKSFGGDLVEFIGEYEWPLRRFPYWFWNHLAPLAMRWLKGLTKWLRRGREADTDSDSETEK
jgi:lipid II:glycine glycyltransferase (peptidoglycan interpeptide bridge formation enzyme)